MKIHSQIDLITNSSTEIFMNYTNSIDKIKETVQSILDLTEPILKVEDIVSMMSGPKKLYDVEEELYKDYKKYKDIDDEDWNDFYEDDWEDKNFDIKEFFRIEHYQDRVEMIRKYIFEIMENHYEYPEWLEDYEINSFYCRDTDVYYKVHNEKYKEIIDNIINTITTINAKGAYNG